MGGALSLLGKGISFGANTGRKAINTIKNSAFTGITNPLKTKTGKALTMFTVGQGLFSPGTSNKEITGLIQQQSSKYFGK